MRQKAGLHPWDTESCRAKSPCISISQEWWCHVTCTLHTLPLHSDREHRKYFLKIECLCASKHWWAQFRSGKNIGGIQTKGLRPGEIQRQGGKDVDCAANRRQIWRRNSMAEGSRHGLKLWFVKQGKWSHRQGFSFTLPDQAVQRMWRELQLSSVILTPEGKTAADLGLSVKILACRKSILFSCETNEKHCKGAGLYDL